MGKRKSILGMLMILIGILIFFYPELARVGQGQKTRKLVEAYDRSAQKVQSRLDTDATQSKQEDPTEYPQDNTDLLYEEIRSYNERLFREGQKGFSSADAVADSLFSEEDFPELLFGYIEIPAMDCILPLYLGASEENMAKGAAVLGETSIPIGGESTNSVIAGHRGYRGKPFFLDIERVKPGDLVYLTNPWEKLTYEVTEIRVIDPNASYELLIREGCDMLSLITCHPYRSHGKYRYVLYCTRKETALTADVTGATDAGDASTEQMPAPVEAEEEMISETAELPDSSETEIRQERWLRTAGAVGIVLCIAMVIIDQKRKGRR